VVLLLLIALNRLAAAMLLANTDDDLVDIMICIVLCIECID